MPISKTELFDDNINFLAKVFAGLGHSARLSLLFYLRDHGNATVGELTESIMLAQSTISEHLKVLKSLSLIKSRRVGTAMQYSLNEDVHSGLKELLLLCSNDF